MPEPLLLTGCTPEPLMNYLKALGILRLISEQADSEARGCWRNDMFVLHSKLDRGALAKFFLNDYQPTPIVGPWAGGSGFFSKDNKKAVATLASPKSSKRCQSYRQSIEVVQPILKQVGVKNKPTPEQKTELLRRYRSELPSEVVSWMDAALVLQNEGQAFAPLLGTGGNDGRLDFSQNFMARLVTLGIHNAVPENRASRWLDNALFGDPTSELAAAAVGQFAPGRAGGPNATQGMEGDSLDNPWDFVLMIEGALMLGGAVVRRLGVGGNARAAFPFTVRSSAAGFASGSDTDAMNARGELWLPLWSRPAALTELKTLFGEGRAEVAGRPARDGVDFARAAASLGVDRGIQQFTRLSFLKRSGKAFLAAPLSRVFVRRQESVDLLRQLDPWLDRFRRACGDKNAPPRFKMALRDLEQAIFEFCQYGGTPFFQAIVAALGRAERELADGGRFCADKRLSPIAGLSADWIVAACDETPEFEIALALSGIHDHERKIGSLRSNLESVTVWRSKTDSLIAKWAEKDRAVVWNSADLSTNLAAVLRRRLMDGERKGCETLPLTTANFISLNTVSRFLAGEIDERRIEDLLWGLMLLPQSPPGALRRPADDADAPPLQRAYALLKLLFLPHPLRVDGQEITIKAEPSIVPLLAAGHVGEACRVVMRRLRASGLSPLPHPRSGGVVRDADWQELEYPGSNGQRLAAALLLPVSYASIEQLRKLVVRDAKDKLQTTR
ncbi:MAG TPA: type I-U CRISPR-associated protein Csx17 [Verrucomicrobiae bacterium]|nr:type I-U CRISPR-associated protein Csx17 [Verrucomicrobiae bacterium]